MLLLPTALLTVALGAAPALPFEKYVLPNGLEVVLHRDARLPTVTVNIWYHVGAWHEPPGRSGFAHLFEHMMFQGSKHVPSGAHIARLEQMGASSINGTTDYDRTNYFETVPTSQLDTVLWLESDRMGFLVNTLSEKKLQTQREVVKNERRETVEASPYGEADEKLVQALFPKPHPYHGAVIGSMKDLDAANVEDIREFFSRWYAPSNATLVVAGDIDPTKVKASIARYFGDLRTAPKPLTPKVTPAVIDHEVVIRHAERVGKLPQLRIAWHTPGFFKEGDAAADILSVILTGNRASRLERRLVIDRHIAQSVHASQQSLFQQSMFEIQVTGRSDTSTEAMLKEVNAELEEIRRHGVSAQEVLRARNRAETSMVSALQAVGGLGGKADTLQLYNHYLGDPGLLGKDLERFEQVTPEAVQAVARDWLKPERRVVVHAVPTVSTSKVSAPAPATTPAPASPAATPAAAPVPPAASPGGSTATPPGSPTSPDAPARPLAPGANPAGSPPPAGETPRAPEGK